ncbi:MAG: non-canonical purine NTP pyrophosphatase, partial [Eubacteriales bacterium]
MKKIVLASRNRAKIKELETILHLYSSDIQVLSLDDIGFQGDIAEDGDTFEQNSLIKARVPASMGYIGVADDSGLCVDALGGAPGVFSARYSGGGDVENNAKLLGALRGVEDKRRGARFVSVISAVFPDGSEISASGEVKG